jgi:hypothetical protein
MNNLVSDTKKLTRKNKKAVGEIIKVNDGVGMTMNEKSAPQSKPGDQSGCVVEDVKPLLHLK